MRAPTLCIVPLLLATLLSQPAEGTFCQAAGHKGAFQVANDGFLLKKTDANEADVYRRMQRDSYMKHLAPSYRRAHWQEYDVYIEIEDVTRGKSVAVMDIKMGTRTYLESEAKNPDQKRRKDLYEKAYAKNKNALTAEDHKRKEMTKLSYMQFRDRLSSTSNYGFRIEAIKALDGKCYNNFAELRSKDEVMAALNAFIKCDNIRRQNFVKALKHIRSELEKSPFFKTHEMVGSSLLFVYDNDFANVSMIDFAKTMQLERGQTVSHRTRWQIGNREDGYLTGLDNLIRLFERGRNSGK